MRTWTLEIEGGKSTVQINGVLLIFIPQSLSLTHWGNLVFFFSCIIRDIEVYGWPIISFRCH